MAQAKRKSSNGGNGSKTGNTGETRGRRTAGREDAIALLKADHREVEGYFEEFEKARSDGPQAGSCTEDLWRSDGARDHRRGDLLSGVPRGDGGGGSAPRSRGGARRRQTLIAEIESSGPDDEYFDAKVTVLSEMIKHHVKEEEQPDGLFAKSRQSEMDLEALGEQLASRKAELMNDQPSKSSRRLASGDLRGR